MNDKDRKSVINHRIKRAHETVLEANLLVENKMYNTAISRLYYASYYAVTALLIKNKIKAHTHGGVRKMFGLHFVKTGVINNKVNKFYSDIFDMRLTGDYDDFIEYSKEEILELIPQTEQLIKEVENLIG